MASQLRKAEHWPRPLVHAEAADTATTDWYEILMLYRVLEVTTGERNPTIALNRIVAAAMVHGDDLAITHLDELAERHPGLPRLAAVRGHLLERLNRPDAAAGACRQAIVQTRNTAERAHLRFRLRRLRQSIMDA
jgi:predicted RNA polymerase sigma factor